MEEIERRIMWLKNDLQNLKDHALVLMEQIKELETLMENIS